MILSNIFGVVIAVMSVLSLQVKDVRAVLLCSSITNVLGTLNYIIIGGLSGCGLYLVASVQAILYLVMRCVDKELPKFLTWVFAAAFVLCSLVTYKIPADVFSALAAVACALALAQKKSSGYRMMIAVNGCMWVMYDICIAAYAMLLSHGITLASALVGIIRLDLKKNKKDMEKK